jgi:acyl dehydratase
MATADTNAIHVEHSEHAAASLVGTSKRPLLHGLCTLGIAVRGIMTFLREPDGVEYEFNTLEADFAKPVYVGDCLMVRLWESETVSPHKASTYQRILSFKVLNSETGDTVVDHGMAQVTRTNLLQTQAKL